jgi:PAS domain S-box-containing protein
MPIRELLKDDFFSEPLALVSRDGTIDTPNRPFAQALGIAPEALAGRRLDALAAASAAAIQEYLSACAASSRVLQGSLMLRRRADTIALHARGIAYPPGAAPSASQVLLNLIAEDRQSTARRKSDREPREWQEIEDSLRRQSQILEVTLASIGDAVIVTDVQGRITFLNSVATALTAWSMDAAQGRPLTEVFHIVNERTRRPVENPVERVLQTGAIAGLANHTVLLARDGRAIPIDDSAAPIRLPDGTLFGAVLIFRDITERRRAEHARAWLAAIIESSDDAIISKTLDGVVTSWNAAAARIFGYSPEEVVGKPITVIIPPELHGEELQVLEKLRRGERVEHFETVRVTKDGRRLDISLTVSPVRDEHGEIVGASKIARNITGRKHAERLLRDAEHRKDEFIAMVAHELRNPLAPLRHAAEMLCASEHENPTVQTACGILDRQLRQMSRLVDDLLDFSRIRTGQLELREEIVDLSALLHGVESSLRPSFEASQQKLLVDVPAEALFVQGDRTRLIQVFTNILQNANKYTPHGGRVTVQLRSHADEGVVTVRDTGIGIPPAMLDRVFEMFTRVDRSRQHASDGLGLGLTLAKRLVELHGGRIEARSEGQDRGSEFIVHLPVRKMPVAVQGDAAQAASVPVPRRILIADDNEDAALSLSMLLQLVGHQTRVAHDGVAAVEVADAFHPEVVLLDLQMPRLDGHNAARQIAARPWASKVLLVALTGWSRQMADRENEPEVFHHVLVKPVEKSRLLEVLAQLDQPDRT